MAVVNIGHYYAEQMPSGSLDKPGRLPAHPQMHDAEAVGAQERS